MEPAVKGDTPRWSNGKLRQFAAAITGSISAFCIGNMLGWTSPMQPYLENEGVGDGPLTTEQVSWVGSVNFIGAIFSSVFWGKLSDLIGRKRTAMVVALPFAVSWILVLSANSFVWLLIARFVVGVGCSGVLINLPMFVTEIAQDDIRGRLGSFLMFSLTGGTLFCYVLGSFCGYVGLSSVCLSVPLIFAGLFSIYPETPVWLENRGRAEEARRSLAWYRGGAASDTDVRKLTTSAKGGAGTGLSSLWATKGAVKATVIASVFVFGQQMCGFMGIMTYAVKIYQISGSVSPHASAIVTGSMQLAAAVLSTVLVDKIGRRALLITSFFTMGSSMLILGYYFYNPEPWYHWFPVVALTFDVVAYSLGAGPVPMIVLGEIFPSELRGVALSVVQFAGTSLSFLSVKIFPTLTSSIGAHGCFWFFSSCNFLATVLIAFLIPETKGKPLSSIIRKLEGDYSSKVTMDDKNVSYEKPKFQDTEGDVNV